jgi:hypothetical protein
MFRLVIETFSGCWNSRLLTIKCYTCFNSTLWDLIGFTIIIVDKTDKIHFYKGTESFPGAKRPGRGADHPPPSSAEVENEYSYPSTPPLGVWWPVACYRVTFTYYQERHEACIITADDENVCTKQHSLTNAVHVPAVNVSLQLCTLCCFDYCCVHWSGTVLRP